MSSADNSSTTAGPSNAGQGVDFGSLVSDIGGSGPAPIPASLSLSLFSDLPPLPDATVLNELVGLYFEKFTPILNIVHPSRFLGFTGTPQQHPAVLVYSMLACSARCHRDYMGKQQLIQSTFYERARRLILPAVEQPRLYNLQALIHLAIYGLLDSLWVPSYMWMGVATTMARLMGINKEFEELKDYVQPDASGLRPMTVSLAMDDNGRAVWSTQWIEQEEKRRCWWYLKAYDTSCAAASKRAGQIPDGEFLSQLLLPSPDNVFFLQTPPLISIARTQTLEDFLNPELPPSMSFMTLGANGYFQALTAIHGRIVYFRWSCAQQNVLPFAPSSAQQAVVLEIELNKLEKDLQTWYKKLSDSQREIESPMEDLRWNEEIYEWAVNLVIYHAGFIALYGPENNLMSIGNQIVGSKQPPAGFAILPTDKMPPTFLLNSMSAAQLDETLASWTRSPHFAKAVEHATAGTDLLKKMMSKLACERRRDSPFLGFCICQLGLLNLIAARQVILMNKGILPTELKNQAQVSISMLTAQSDVFTASAKGRELLRKVLVEVSGGEMTLVALAEMLRRDPQSVGYREGGGAMMEALINMNTGKTMGVLLDEPGQCAGTMIMTGDVASSSAAASATAAAAGASSPVIQRTPAHLSRRVNSDPVSFARDVARIVQAKASGVEVDEDYVYMG